MKNLILMITLLVSANSFAQEIVVVGQKRPPMNFSVNYNGPAVNYFGIGIEVGDYTDTGMSEIFNVNYGITTVSRNNVDRDGEGYSIDAGGRQYIIMNQSYARFYMENLFSYSRLEF